MRAISKQLLALCCILGVLAVEAQTPNIQQTAGIYYAYPGPTEPQKPAPDGYKPFYISHYGRHGSRWITDDSRYLAVLDVLNSLHDSLLLTDLGCDVRLRVITITDDALGRSGSLSPIGERQHQGIAQRMHDNFPEVFADSAEIKAVSSTSLRCAMSMAAFLEQLKEINPSLNVKRQAYQRDMDYLAYTSAEGKAFSDKSSDWWREWDDYVTTMVDTQRFISALVTEPEVLSPSEQFDLMMGLYWMASDMQDVEIGENLYDIFTYDELNGIWRTINARMYACNGNAPLNQGVMKHCADNLLRDIVSCADGAIVCGAPAANLRFGHDTHLLRLLALICIEGCYQQEVEMARFHEVWQDYKLSPMAANLQMILYSNDDGEILVKFLLNENDAYLPITSHIAPYYTWDQVRFHLISQLD